VDGVDGTMKQTSKQGRTNRTGRQASWLAGSAQVKGSLLRSLARSSCKSGRR
jgi:hypothetical protein